MIEWEDKFSVGISEIDEEHKKLIDILNKAVFANEHNGNTVETLEILGNMIEYSRKHFSTEETYMLKFKFPDYQLHKNEHLDFTDKTIRNYRNFISGDYQIANEILEYLKQWLINHIQVTDKRYIDCFKKNGLI
ncbi:MAG: bacteriohemerythrin [Candidatus Scalindua sp.]|jgi:hemerythrin|nr:bacteriohemerythrin [Candidatus Scalindua sp.]